MLTRSIVRSCKLPNNESEINEPSINTQPITIAFGPRCASVKTTCAVDSNARSASASPSPPLACGSFIDDAIDCATAATAVLDEDDDDDDDDDDDEDAESPSVKRTTPTTSANALR